MGSAPALARQLGDLNAATWKAGASQIARWARRPPLDDAALEANAPKSDGDTITDLYCPNCLPAVGDARRMTGSGPAATPDAHPQ